ncbi:hypothetical protein SAMN05444008_106208 [Cnuella takakiae]|uniref:Uncharacterized protein n=1 Tax=Cnuella takakiae TaxID=1302690 RepID=A0A1M5ACF2_9BACT|nr:DUF6544 family protein [Cnuella takakiae]OLY92014.1 hypothetical protein BUE76_08970 [Cnuella takakiae]SHF27953.1 hypothetical protein SAMN05444008_106208 [Cnuella takakiae]
MRYLIALLLSLHGTLHLMGFAKAFSLGNFGAISSPISKNFGLAWLIAALLLLAAAALMLLQQDTWWAPALGGLLLSQILVFGAWSDARWGTVANLLLLAAALPAFAEWRFESQYRADVQGQFQRIGKEKEAVISAADLAQLPPPVQRYLYYTGCVGKAKVRQMRVRFNGHMREKDKNFFAFQSEQVKDFKTPARYFFMRATVNGLPTTGYHRFAGGHASMNIRVLSAIPVVQSRGGELDQAETVTFFNDMCVLAPATLVDTRIRWEAIDDASAKAYFTNGSTTISALLLFNKNGELVNFISDDRFAMNAGKLEQHRFSTPLSEYKWFGGYRLASKGEAVWHYPDGLFSYGEFELQSVAYNEAAVQL